MSARLPPPSGPAPDHSELQLAEANDTMSAPQPRSSRARAPRATRYPLRLPVELPAGSGVTRNISASGILFEASAGPGPPALSGDTVRLRVLLCDRPGEIPLQLAAEARVVRVERQAAGMLIAVTTSAVQLMVAADDRR
jgi:hypothetical protein